MLVDIIINKMKKNYTFNFKADAEFKQLLEKALMKVEKDSEIPFNRQIHKSDFMRSAIKRICLEVLSGEIQSSILLYQK